MSDPGLAELAGTGVAPCPFDSDALGLPWFRIAEPARPGWEAGIAALVATGRAFGADAKLPADALAEGWRLERAGFVRICVQTTWRRSVVGLPAPEEVEILDRLALPDAELDAHGANFRFDRFSQDRRLPRDGIARLYRRWLASSLSGRRLVARCGSGLCTFSVDGEQAAIDLVSVLEPGHGLGRAVVVGAVAAAHARGARTIRVTTESENPRAWRIYQALGFQLEQTTAVRHLVVESGTP